MCVVSMIGDHYGDKWHIPPTGWQPTPVQDTIWRVTTNQTVTREEFDKLRADVEEMKQLLQKAKAYDERNNEPNCEMEDKIEVLRRVAELAGVDLSEVL